MNHTKLNPIKGLARVAALTTATATLLAVAATAASATTAPAASGPVQGNNVCTINAGTMSFNPALRENGNGNTSYVSLTLQLRNCSTAAAPSGTFTGSPSFFLANDSCRSLFSAPPPADPVSGAILWMPRSANRATDISFTGRSESSGPPVRFTLSGGTAYGRSFDGTAKSGFSLAETGAQFNAACGSSHGLAQLTVKNGSFNVGPNY
jgi:hypothetical protein